MSDGKLDYLDFDSLYRFDFTGTSLAWGLTIGILLSCHRYSRISKTYLDLIKESVFFGSFFGFLTATGMWGYNYYKFSISQNILQQQNYERQEKALKLKFIESYFKKKYDLQDSDSDKVALVIQELDNKWNQLESQLSSED